MSAADRLERGRRWWRETRSRMRRIVRPAANPLFDRAGTLLSDQGDALARLGIEIEQRFLAMGETLQAQAALTRHLRDHGARLAGVAVGTGDAVAGDAASAAVGFAARTLEAMEACGRERQDLLDRLERYHAQTGRLLQEEAQVERILAPLRVIQMFFRIESARLPAEMQTGFHALSGEIPKFEQQVRDTFGRHAETLTVTCRNIESAGRRMRDQDERTRQAVQTDRARLDQALAALTQEASVAQARHDRLAALISEIDQEAQSLVVGLQYQDITRQKMEHVRAVLGELHAAIADPAETEGGLARLGHTCALEASQCRAVGEELDRALTSIGEGSRGIRDRLGHIEAECWSRRTFPAAVSAARTRAAALESVLLEIKELVPSMLESSDEALRIVNSFSHVAADVAATARDLAENMRLIALNAQVLAAQAGAEGAGLLVLAERTYGISEEVRRVTESISREFADASAALATVLAQRDRMEQRARHCREVFESEGHEVLHAVIRGRDDTIAALEAIAAGIEELDRRTLAMSAEADARPELVSALAGIQRALADFAADCGTTDDSAAATAHLVQRYTMASERDVHAAACGTAVTATEPAPSVAEAPGELGANVELF